MLAPSLGSPPDADVFRPETRVTLAEVLAAAEIALEGSARRDTRSAFALLTRAGINLAGRVATAGNVRTIFDTLSPARLGVTEKRLANIRSLVIRAVERFGQERVWITREITPGPEWQDLFSRIENRQYLWALNRLACYCTVKGIPPHQVTVETLRGLFIALEAEAMTKDPRNLLKHTIAIWNMCHKRVPGWPDRALSSPFKTAPAMLPLEAFPPTFRADVAAWEERMRHPDVIDVDAPLRPLREVTLEGYRFTFRRIASTLVRAGAVEPADVTGLAVFFQVDHFSTALREYLPGRTRDYVHKMAAQLLVVARVHLKFDEAQLKPFKAKADRLKSKGGQRMGQRNLNRLGQFDDPDVVQRLLRFPEEELGRALRLTNPVRRAKGVERALAISLAIFTGLRVKNLRSLDLDRNLRRSSARVFVQIPEEEAKTGRPFDLELPQETITLLDLFVTKHRRLLPGWESPYLFPGENGAPRSYSAMRDTLGRALRKHAGIELSPHLYRHIIAKIVMEKNPELIHEVSRRLGHSSINTTYQSYLGTEGPAASRRINKLLQKVRDDEGKAA